MKKQLEEIFDSCLSIENPVETETNLSSLPSSAGLVLFADSQDIPILLLTAANIRRTTKNKLAQQDEKTKRADLKSITAKIYYKTYPCKFRLALAHHNAVKKTFGQNYKDHITIVWPAFIKIDFTEKIPFFSVTKKSSFDKKEEILGPFPTQKSAKVFLNTLEDAFKLCKRNDLVNNPAQAASCPYLQMDTCCGVCGGKVSPEDYRVIIKDAFEAGAQPEKTIERLGADMQTAAKDLNFEQADEIKRKIEKLSALKKQTYRWTGDLEKLKIVHIDKSVKIKPQDSKKKKQTYAVFVMNFFEMIDSGDFVIDETDKIAEAIENALAKLNISQQGVGDSVEILEQFAIVSYFLYCTKPRGLWMDASRGFDREELLKFKI